MKKVRETIYICVLIFLVAFNLTGCMEQAQVEGLMEAPLSVKKQEINTMIYDCIGKDSKMVTPSNLKSPIIKVDLQNDGREENIVFYTEKNKDNFTVHTAVFDFNEGKIVSQTYIENICNDVDKVFFEDVDGDGSLEMNVGFTDENTNIKGLKTYKYKDGELKMIFSSPYTEFLADDLDEDGKSELIVTTKDEQEVECYVTVFKYNGYKMEAIAKGEIAYGYVMAVKTGKVNKENKGIFVDSIVGAHSSETDVFVYKENSLINPFEGKKAFLFNPYGVISKDIDEDGIIEVARQVELPGYEFKDYAAKLYKLQWYKWDGDEGLNYVSDSIENYRAAYEIVFLDKLDEDVSVVREQNDLCYIETYIRYKGELLEDAEKIFEIVVFNQSEIPENKDEGLISIGKNNGSEYFLKVLNLDLFNAYGFDTQIKNNFYMR